MKELQEANREDRADGQDAAPSEASQLDHSIVLIGLFGVTDHHQEGAYHRYCAANGEGRLQPERLW
eukprot:CAMPEP_0184476460 /NCGR_PEP_ID=MMETSP0740-20130409/147094_1 /TAXON_ID=385413 /ORGANISM="Thalassiosira miniscula, Strain CCMP1093" /LENGTH=65 /DNA_ID=CAMNT_0026854021 /DNA_START=1400 /DNA_END=1594 /DNA_ORIENTATION=-